MTDVRDDLRATATQLLEGLFRDADHLAATMDGCSIDVELRLTVTDGQATATIPTGVEGYVDSRGTWHREVPLTLEAIS